MGAGSLPDDALFKPKALRRRGEQARMTPISQRPHEGSPCNTLPPLHLFLQHLQFQSGAAVKRSTHFPLRSSQAAGGEATSCVPCLGVL